MKRLNYDILQHHRLHQLQLCGVNGSGARFIYCSIFNDGWS